MKRAMIFAHYDVDGIIDPHVEYYLYNLRKYVSKLIFISTSAGDEELSKLENICDIYIKKNNSGYDFASWKYGLELLKDKDSFDEIIFANDSVYAPIFCLDEFFKNSENITAPFWGATVNLQKSPHVQSFFFVFRKELVLNPLFIGFWDDVVDIENKDEIIDRYEIGLTRKIVEAGYSFSSVFDPRKLTISEKVKSAFSDIRYRNMGFFKRLVRSITKANSPRSPMQYLWRSVLKSGVPMIKVELLRDNPCLLNESAIWDYLEQHPEASERIKTHLLRVRKN